MILSALEHLEALPARLLRWGAQLHAAHLCYSISPIVIAAILEQESRGGDALSPVGPGGTGDGGHGRGLMQIDDRFHPSFIAAKFDDGLPLWKDPTQNIMYGTRLLRRNLDAAKGNMLAAIAAYNCGLSRVLRVLKTLPVGIQNDALILALDEYTARKSYVKKVVANITAYTKQGTPNV